MDWDWDLPLFLEFCFVWGLVIISDGTPGLLLALLSELTPNIQETIYGAKDLTRVGHKQDKYLNSILSF